MTRIQRYVAGFGGRARCFPPLRQAAQVLFRRLTTLTDCGLRTHATQVGARCRERTVTPATHQGVAGRRRRALEMERPGKPADNLPAHPLVDKTGPYQTGVLTQTMEIATETCLIHKALIAASGGPSPLLRGPRPRPSPGAARAPGPPPAPTRCSVACACVRETKDGGDRLQPSLHTRHHQRTWRACTPGWSAEPGCPACPHTAAGRPARGRR